MKQQLGGGSSGVRRPLRKCPLGREAPCHLRQPCSACTRYAVSRRPIAVTPVATKKRISSSTVVGQRFDGQFRRLTPVRNERLVAASGPGRSGARAAPLVRTLHAHWGARRSTTRISAPHLENAGRASDNDLALNPRQVEFCDDKNNAHIPLIVEQCYDDIDNHCSGCSSMQVRCARTRRGALLKR